MNALIFHTVGTAIGADEPALDLGAAAPGSSKDVVLYLANDSYLYQAQDVTVSVDVTGLWLSTDGEVFTAHIDVGDIPPGGVSPNFWLRLVVASSEADGGQSAALFAAPAAWVNPVDTSTSANSPLT